MAPPYDYPKLPRLQCVHGAAAAASQRLERAVTVYPRGFAPSRTAQTHSSMVPAVRSALWFRELHAGFRAAHFLFYSTQIPDALKISTAETFELKAAALGAPAPDDGLPPRGLAVWVLVGENATSHPDGAGQRVLDALAHWATGPTPAACEMRLGVATGAMAVTVLNIAAKEGADRSGLAHSSWSLVVRWADAKGATHSAMEPLGGPPCTADAALERMQRALCAVLGRYDMRAPLSAVWHPTPVPLDAFAVESTVVDNAFSGRLEAPPSTMLSAAADASDAAPLENTGIFVRVCERKRGDDGATHPSAFHGVLLSFGAAKEDAAAFANAADPTLPCPVGLQEESMGLHMCAVQAEECRLGRAISHYAHVGCPGKPIHSPGSYVYRECAAIRPVDASLLMHWDLRPCDKLSTLPGNPLYHSAFQEHFTRASRLYLSLSQGVPRVASAQEMALQRRSYSSSDHLDALLCAPAVDDAHADRDNAALQLALHVDLRSRRTTIGEAYAYLFDKGLPRALGGTMLHSMARLGVRASLDDMFQLASESLAQQATTVTVEAFKETQRLKRLSDVCLAALAAEDGCKRARPTPVVVSAPERVRRMLATLGIKKGAEAMVLPNMNDASVARAISVVVEALHHLAPNGTFLRREGNEALPFGPCRVEPANISQAHWIGIADSAISCVATVFLMRNELSGTVYLITSVAKSGTLTIQRIVGDQPSRREPASFDELIATPRGSTSVLLLQHLDGDECKCKLTATVTIPTPPPKTAA